MRSSRTTLLALGFLALCHQSFVGCQSLNKRQPIGNQQTIIAYNIGMDLLCKLVEC